MISFIPRIHCAKCSKDVIGKRRMTGREPNKQKRFIEVTCHGEREQLAFAASPDEKVELWQPPLLIPPPSSN